MESDNAPTIAASAPATDAAKALKKQLCALSKTFGHIPNVPVFSHWATRMDCCDSAVHRAPMAGICGSRSGVYSLVLSQAYKDDQDGGDVIFYTGVGGRERWSSAFPSKRIRLGPQTKDQSWESTCNRALQISLLTGNPVRVVRSSRCRSQYAPLEGYRYDGLYKVAACWTAKGHTGKNICRCRLERLPNQPPIPRRHTTTSASSGQGAECPVPTPSSPSTQRGSGACAMSEGSLNEPSVTDTQPAQRAAPTEPGALPRYRWNPQTHELVRVRPSDVICEAERVQEEHQAEDDHAQANEFMECECESVL